MPEIKRESTSIKIDPELWKEAKIEAIRRDMDLSQLVEQALRKELGKLKSMSQVREK
jgi:predicted HicB family RNase H-like nuclease